MTATVPGLFWVLVIALSIPAVIPIVENAFPAASNWWSAVLVAVLYSILSAIYIFFRKPLSELGLEKPPTPASDVSPGSSPPSSQPEPKKLRAWFWGT